MLTSYVQTIHNKTVMDVILDKNTPLVLKYLTFSFVNSNNYNYYTFTV